MAIINNLEYANVEFAAKSKFQTTDKSIVDYYLDFVGQVTVKTSYDLTKRLVVFTVTKEYDFAADRYAILKNIAQSFSKQNGRCQGKSLTTWYQDYIEVLK